MTASPCTLAAQDGASSRATPVVEAQPISDRGDIRLDGLLNEPAWQTAVAATGFRQLEPDEGEPATEETEVRVLFNGAYLYIGVRAFDSEPDRIIARQLERDARIGASRFGPGGGDDSIEIILDTFHDRRNAYYFATNPNGVLVDGLITDESFRVDRNWDAVWDVRARRTAEGWSAEIEIPLRSIRFEADGQAWGFNVQRFIGRKNEQNLWTSWSRDGEGLNRISRAGELTGLQSLPEGLNLYVKPYVLSEAAQDWELPATGEVDVTPRIGADAKLGLPSGMVVDLTVNTDFAQVEADDEQIDLTRFNLFFPEKREFFLENAGIFDFGATGFGRAPPFLLFFSRRIGLAEGETVPMIAGGRLTGRAGRQTIGFLDVVTGEDLVLDEDDELVRVPVTNFAVGRLKRDVGRRSYIGAMVTSRIEDGGYRNLAGGIDWNLWLTNNAAFEGFYARSDDTQPGGDDQSWRASLDYTGDWIGGRVQHLEIGPDMEPGVGFIRREDVAETSGSLRLTARPPISGLRRIDIRNNLNYVTSVSTRSVEDRGWRMTIAPELDSGDEADIEIQYLFQRLVEEFELEDSVIVPPGDYVDWNFELRLNSSPVRPVVGELSAGTGSFWGGTRRNLGGELGFNSPHVGFGLGYEHNDVDVPGGAFTTDLVSGRIRAALNTKLFGAALLQYNSQSGAFSANVRINWIHRPGSDLFIVFNEQRDIVGSRWNPAARAFIVKFTYLYWF